MNTKEYQEKIQRIQRLVVVVVLMLVLIALFAGVTFLALLLCEPLGYIVGAFFFVSGIFINRWINGWLNE